MWTRRQSERWARGLVVGVATWGIVGGSGIARAHETVPVAEIVRETLANTGRTLYILPHFEAPLATGYMLDDIEAKGHAKRAWLGRKQPLTDVQSVEGEGFRWTVRFKDGTQAAMKWPTIVDEKGETVTSFGGRKDDNAVTLRQQLAQLGAPELAPIDPALAGLGRDLTAMARAGKLRPAVGRERELRMVVRTLLRDSKATPLLLGEPGVGKTAVVEELARQIAGGELRELAGHRVFALDLAEAVAGTKHRGELEGKIQTLKAALEQDPKIILFVDEIHNLPGAGAAEGALSIGEMLKPILARPGVKLIGATTTREHRARIAQDGALDRRFTPVEVAEPTPAQAEKMLEGLRGRLEAHHGVRIAPAALKAAVSLSVKHLPDRRLPDKAIDLVDEAAAEARLGRDPWKVTVGANHVTLIMKERLGGALKAPRARR